MDRKKFSNLLIELRKENNYTQQDFAEIFNVTFQAVSRWETGESLPDITILEKISEFYNISINDLLKGERNYKSNKVEKDKPIKEHFENELNKEDQPKKKEIFKLVFCPIMLVLFLIFCFLPAFIVSFYYTGPWGEYNSYAGDITFYQIIFSNSYKNGNFIFLILFLCFVLATIMGFCSRLVKNNKVLLVLEECFSLISLNGFYLFYLIFSSAEIYHFSFLVIAIVMATYYLMLTLNKKMNMENNVSNKYQLLISRYAILGSDIIYILLFNHVTISFIVLLLPLLCSFIFNGLLFKNDKNVFNILYYIFVGIFVLINVFLSTQMTEPNIFLYFLIHGAFILTFELVRNHRIKKYKIVTEN